MQLSCSPAHVGGALLVAGQSISIAAAATSCLELVEDS